MITLHHIKQYLPTNHYIINEALANDLIIEKIVGTIPGSTNGLTFVDHNRTDQQALVEKTESKIIVCSNAIQANEATSNKVLIKVANPKLIFSIIGNALFLPKPIWGIHPTAVIHPNAQIHPETYIGPNCFIGNCTIGKHTVLEGSNHIYDRVKIGANVIIYAGCVVGSIGYGYIRNEENFPIQFPHVGGVIIEDFAELGTNSAIDIGSLGNTIIGWGSKIDNLVHIGHNVVIGKCVYVAASTSIAGSSKIGNYANIWTGVRIADGITIGENAYIGMGSVVINNIPEKKKCFGNPARVIGSVEE